MASAALSSAQLGVSRVAPPDLGKRAHALLAERFPPLRVRHKPLSILRQEGRRALEQFLDSQVPPPPKPERDRLIEEVIGEASGFGPLEELFRDEGVKEIMVLAAAQVIARKDAGWVPTSVRFRDPAHHRGYLRRVAETGEPLAPGGAAGEGAFDVRLANGFRVVGVLPPDVLDQPPLAVFVRGQAAAVMATPAPVGGSGGVTVPLSRVGSGVMSAGNLAIGPSASGRMPRPELPPAVRPPSPPEVSVSDSASSANLDAKERVRRRVYERITRKCAAAGVYDLSAIPANELQRVIMAHVEELNAEELLRLTDHEVQILTLEIYAGMRR